MFSGKKDVKAKKPRRGGNLAQFGLMDVPDMDNMAMGEGDSDGDDAALEAELLALTGGGGGERKKPRQGKGAVSTDQLAKMVSDCMRDDDDDVNLSDEDDPELLAELSALSATGADDEQDLPASRPPPMRNYYRNPEPITPRQAPMAAGESVMGLLSERRAMYEQAEAIAKAEGDSSRARRFGRGLKTIIQMEKSVKAGRSINEDEIPPPVLVKGGGGERRVGSAGESSNTSPDTSPPSEDGPPPYTSNTPAHNSIPHGVVFQERDKLSPTTPRENPPQAIEQQQPLRPAPQAPSRPAPQPAPRSVPQVAPQPDPIPTASSSDPAFVVKRLHEQYKAAALAAKRSGNKEHAVQYLRTMKQMEPMLRAAEAGQPVDLASLPAPPSASSGPPPSQPAPRETAVPVGAASASVPTESTSPAPVDPGEGAPDGPPPPKNILEALEQRLTKYVEMRDKAKNEGNARKERMNQRIIKQYEDAIKKQKAGKPVDFDDLPTPFGYAPIPVAGTGTQPPASVSEGGQGGGSKATADSSQSQQGGGPPTRKPAPAPPTNVRQAPQSRVEKQLAFLTKRQNQFKQAALDAKKKGEIAQAKEYLRMSKGFDQLIEATKNGLPVDMNTVPVPPQEQMPSSTSVDFELVSSEDCVTAPENTCGDVAVTYTKLEEDLIAQIKMCAQTREHFKATGDVASANRFEQLILHTKKDLDAVRAGFKRGTTPPRFHYETRTFNIIQCNTDLNDSDCEVVVARGINFNVSNPKDVDTFLRLEFPYPSDNPPQDKSNVVKDTNNPEYNHKAVFSIDRKSRALARLFKRQSIKVQVYAKGGWFQRSTILGSVKIPLVSLETKCTLHDSYDLLDERKKMVGGKLEVKVRLRNPIVTKQLEKVTEKWLVIDGF